MRNLMAVATVALPLLSLAAMSAAAQQQEQPRESAIVGGHHIQPRADEFKGNHPDVPPAQDKEVDSLYQQVLRDSAAPIDSGNVAGPKSAAPDGVPKPH